MSEFTSFVCHVCHKTLPREKWHGNTCDICERATRDYLQALVCEDCFPLGCKGYSETGLWISYSCARCSRKGIYKILD